jgi:ABC-type sugar transport system substrate-binding protein
MKKILLFAAALMISTFRLSAASADSGEFVFILKGRGNVFWQVVRNGIDETASERGVSSVILHTDDDQTPEAQLNICLTSIARKPKVIVLGAATRNVGIECFKKAAAAGITVADIDGNVTIDEARAAGVSMAFTVASDNYGIGKLAAERLAQIASSPSPRVLVIKGLPGSIVSEKRARGFVDRLRELMPGALVVGEPDAYWDRMKAMNTTLDVIQREAQLDYIFSVSDAMTTGIVEALKITRKADRIKIISVDGLADARKAVISDRIESDVAQLPYLMGKRAVELAIDSAANKMLGQIEYVPTPVLTKESLLANQSPYFKYLR